MANDEDDEVREVTRIFKSLRDWRVEEGRKERDWKEGDDNTVEEGEAMGEGDGEVCSLLTLNAPIGVSISPSDGEGELVFTVGDLLVEEEKSEISI